MTEPLILKGTSFAEFMTHLATTILFYTTTTIQIITTRNTKLPKFPLLNPLSLCSTPDHLEPHPALPSLASAALSPHNLTLQNSAKIAKKLEPSQALAAPLPHKLTHFRAVPKQPKKTRTKSATCCTITIQANTLQDNIKIAKKNLNQVSYLLQHYHTILHTLASERQSEHSLNSVVVYILSYYI